MATNNLTSDRFKYKGTVCWNGLLLRLLRVRKIQGRKDYWNREQLKIFLADCVQSFLERRIDSVELENEEDYYNQYSCELEILDYLMEGLDAGREMRMERFDNYFRNKEKD